MAINNLNDKQIRGGIKLHDEKVAAKTPGSKMVITSLPDGGGLRLDIRDTGAPRWVFRYTRPGIGKPNEMKLGIYPDITLSMAREIASSHRAKVQQGIDPATEKVEAVKAAKAEAVKATRTFGLLLEEFKATKYRDLASTTIDKNDSRINNHLGKLLPMALEEITPQLLLAEILRPINSPDTQARVRQLIGQVFKFAIASGDTFFNPARDISGALPKHRRKHFAAVKDVESLKKIWLSLECVESIQTRCALQLQFLLFQRPGNTRSMEWSELDLEKKVWTIPAKKMKLVMEDKEDEEKEHRVPLPALALKIISEVPKIHPRFLFPITLKKGIRDRPICDATMGAGLRSVGIPQTMTVPHGSRTTADSLMNEACLFNPDAIERLLAHKLEGGDVRNAYNRADFWDERVRAMDWWGELFESFTSTSTSTSE